MKVTENGIYVYYYSEEKRLGVNKWWKREKVKFYPINEDIEESIKNDINKWNQQKITQEMQRIRLK